MPTALLKGCVLFFQDVVVTRGVGFVTLLCLLLPLSGWVHVCLRVLAGSFSQCGCSLLRLERPFASLLTISDISEHVFKNEAYVSSSQLSGDSHDFTGKTHLQASSSDSLGYAKATLRVSN